MSSDTTANSASSFFATLSDTEIFWRNKCAFLASHGYELRPRYHPDWRPSWLQPRSSRTSFLTVEDAWGLPIRSGLFIDATRASDGQRVYLKQVRTDSLELQLMLLFCLPEYHDDPRNHCVPLLDVIPDDVDPDLSYMVMPFLRPFDSPAFETVGECVYFVDQLLEGLSFQHELRIAHRDCTSSNVMMDAEAMFPEGHHPILSLHLPDLSGSAWPRPRSDVSVRYYFIDFGISSHFPPGTSGPTLVQGSAGIDREPPELLSGDAYDPFKLDVFLIGNLLRRKFLDVYSNVSFLEPLVVNMVHPNPSMRPDAPDVLHEWYRVRRQVSFVSRLWRLRRRDESVTQQIGMDLYGMVKSGLSGTTWRRYM